MPHLVHLAPESLTRRIKRSGLRGLAADFEMDARQHHIDEVIFAMPVLQDDQVTLTFGLEKSPPQYGAALDLIAKDCNTTKKIIFKIIFFMIFIIL